MGNNATIMLSHILLDLFPLPSNTINGMYTRCAVLPPLEIPKKDSISYYTYTDLTKWTKLYYTLLVFVLKNQLGGPRGRVGKVAEFQRS